MSHTKKIAVVTNVIPQYREDMYRRLFEYYGSDLQVYCQSDIPGVNLNLVHEKFKNNITLIKYISLRKEKLAWQFVPFIKLLTEYDIIFIYGNPRVLSSVFGSLILRVVGKKVVIWGQYHTASSSEKMKKLRLGWWSLFNYIFLYTDKEAIQYKERYPGTLYVTGMNNGVNQNEITAVVSVFSENKLTNWIIENDLEGKVILLSCARLDKKNQFDMVVECLPEIIEKYPNILWCVIGDGDEGESLRTKASKMGVSQYIKWLGPVYEQEKLAPWFLSARCLIHPGSIGLSLMHAMGYGLPVITHDNENHQMPEIAALVNGKNGVLFKEKDKSSLIEKISLLIEDDEFAKNLSSHAKQTVTENYNTKMMADKFVEMVNKIEKEM